MIKCPECQIQKMEVIGTENLNDNVKQENSNFVANGIRNRIFIVHYCKKCNVIFLREPLKVFG